MKSIKTPHRLWRAAIGFSVHDGSLVAAGIAYYVALSFFPLMLVLVAGVAYAMRTAEQEARQRVLDAIVERTSPELEVPLKEALSAAATDARTGGTIGFIALVITAVAIFAQVEYAFDRIWHMGVERRETWGQWIWRLVFARFKALVMLMGVGAFLLATMIASVVWDGMQKTLAPVHIDPWVAWLAGFGINVLLNFMGFALLYKIVPKPHIRWGEAYGGALVASPLWEIGRQVLSMYLLRLNYPTAYGIIGSFLAIMLWAYYAMLVVLFGAEYVRVMQHERVETRK